MEELFLLKPSAIPHFVHLNRKPLAKGGGMRRISVVANNEVVPLFSGSPMRDSRFSPWNGLVVETHSVGAIEVPEHQHPTLCLHLQTKGQVEMQWSCDGKEDKQTMSAGSLILLKPGAKDTLKLSRPSYRTIVSIEEPLLSRASTELEMRGELSFQNRWIFEDKQLRLLLMEIEREMEENWIMGPLYGDLLGMSLSLALVKKYGHVALPRQHAQGGLSRARLLRVLDYINDNSHRDVRLSELAEVAETSRFHFARLFRECMGVPPHQYLMQQRIEKAKLLLRTPRHNVNRVAAATGFTNASHFAKAFRRIVGVSPSDWKAGV
jgi:AraC family transcriptional regulator